MQKVYMFQKLNVQLSSYQQRAEMCGTYIRVDAALEWMTDGHCSYRTSVKTELEEISPFVKHGC